MQASTPPHTKHKANIIASSIAISYLHTDTRERLQYYVECKGLNVTMTIHTAHAQKHFSPETKSKVRPKKIFAREGNAWNDARCGQELSRSPDSAMCIGLLPMLLVKCSLVYRIAS